MYIMVMVWLFNILDEVSTLLWLFSYSGIQIVQCTFDTYKEDRNGRKGEGGRKGGRERERGREGGRERYVTIMDIHVIWNIPSYAMKIG